MRMIYAEQEKWGSIGEKTVYLFQLRDAAGMALSVSNYGGIIQSWRIPEAGGAMREMVLGYDTLTEYRSSATFFGAAIGPIADRLADGCCCVGGVRAQFPRNAGPDCMHSGPDGFHTRIWNARLLENGIALSYQYAVGEMALPGSLRAEIRYLLLPENTLRIEYAAECDRETALSLTNHSYFTLSGGEAACTQDVLTVHADTYAETVFDAAPICTGRRLPVDGTPLDLRSGRVIGEVLAHADFPELRRAGGVDHFFPIDGAGMREHARLRSEREGLELICTSDAPGVLVYTGNGLENERGRQGKTYRRNYAVCLETECFPNAINFPEHCAKVILPAGTRFASCTEFSVRHI